MPQISQLSKTDKIKILAVIAMIKKLHWNSILYVDKHYKNAQRIGIDPKTFKKYFTMAFELNLVEIKDNRYIISKWSKACLKLLDISSKQVGYFDKPFRECKKFKEFQSAIEKRIVGLNLKSQENRINKNSNEIKNAQLANFLRVKPKRFKTVLNNKKRSKVKNINHIVSGVNHMAKLIGKSHTTAGKRFKLWEKQGCLSFKPVVKYVPTADRYYSAAIVEIMNESKRHGGLVLPYCNGYKVIMGRKITAFSMGIYKYGLQPNPLPGNCVAAGLASLSHSNNRNVSSAFSSETISQNS